MTYQHGGSNLSVVILIHASVNLPPGFTLFGDRTEYEPKILDGI